MTVAQEYAVTTKLSNPTSIVPKCPKDTSAPLPKCLCPRSEVWKVQSVLGLLRSVCTPCRTLRACLELEPLCIAARAGQFSWKQIQLDSIRQNVHSIRFTTVASLGAEAIYELWSALLNVLAKLLTVISFISLGLAVNAQWRKYDSKNILLSIFLNFL